MDTSQAQLCDDLLAISHQVKIALHRVAELYELTPVQVAVMHALFEQETSMGHVAHQLHCDASNVTGIIDRLVAQHYVTRQESEQDRRTKVLRLTAKGEHTIRQIIDKLPDFLGCQNVTDDERVVIHQATLKLIS